MTVRLLKPYAQRPVGAIATFDASTEAGMIEAKQASADLTGGFEYFLPRPGLKLQVAQIAVGSVSLRAAEQAPVILPEGQVLYVSGGMGAVGKLHRLDPAGGNTPLQSWAFGAGALAPIGPYVGEQRFLLTCTTGAVQAAVRNGVVAGPRMAGGVQGGTVSRSALTSLRYEALSKSLPSAANLKAFNQTASLQPNKFCSTVKKEEEAPFVAMRLVAVNRGAVAISAISALVGVSDTADFSTSQRLSTPTINGVSYPALQGATDVNGFRAVTWGGASSAPIAAGDVGQKLAISDWAPKLSVPRTDGGVRPFSIVRPYVDGTIQPVPYQSYYTAILQTPQPAMRGRIVQASNANADGVSSPAQVMNAAPLPGSILCLEVFPILRYSVPVCSVWLSADSIGDGSGLVADHISNWMTRAVYDLSTPDRPVVPSNMACSGINSQTYIQVCRDWLAAGVPAPSVLIMAPASVNDSGYDLNFQERHCSQAIEAAKLCVDYKIPYLFMYGLLPNDGATLAQDNVRKATNARLKAIAESMGATWLDFSALGDGASPERFVTKYKFDALHPNELAIEEIMAPVARAAIALVL